MTEHTPAPWNAASAYSSICGVPIISRTGKRIGNTAIPDMPPEWDSLKKEAVANAAYLCMCVNSHDALVKALTEIDTLATCSGVVDPTQHANMLANIYRTVTVPIEALRNCHCPSDGRWTIGDCTDAGTCGCSIALKQRLTIPAQGALDTVALRECLQSIAGKCFQASIIRADLKTGLSAAFPSTSSRSPATEGGGK